MLHQCVPENLFVLFNWLKHVLFVAASLKCCNGALVFTVFAQGKEHRGNTMSNPYHARFRYGEVATAVTYHGTAVHRRGRRQRSLRPCSELYALDHVLAGALPFQASAARSGCTARASQGVVYPFRRECISHCHVQGSCGLI